MRLVDVLALGGALVVGSLTGGGCSCSDDDGGLPDSGADAQGDAAADGPLSGTRSGTLALTQFTVSDAPAQGVALAGLSVAASFDDLTTATVAPAYTDGATGCTVFRYQVGTDSEPTEVDEGPISVTGFGPYGDFTCAFNAGLGEYLCSSNDAAASGTTAMNGSTAIPVAASNPPVVDVTIGGADFTMLNPRGMVVSFPAGTWDNDVMNAAHPITDFDAASSGTLTILNPGLAAPSTVTTENDYSTLIGEGPVPGAVDGNGTLQPFDALDGAATFSVAGGGADGGAIDAFDKDITPATLSGGNALVLADDSMQPTEFPDTAADTKVSCDAAQNGTCENGGVLNALIVSGETTDGVLPTGGNPISDATAMPDPVTEYATFTCVFLGQKSGTIPEAAITEILGTSPTRVETRVIYASGAIVGEADGDITNILSGYGLVGHTDL